MSALASALFLLTQHIPGGRGGAGVRVAKFLEFRLEGRGELFTKTGRRCERWKIP